MTSISSSSSSAPVPQNGSKIDWQLRLVRGEGREHRMKIAKDYLARVSSSLLAKKEEILREIEREDGYYRCRLFCRIEKNVDVPEGVMVFDSKLTNHFEKEGMRGALDIVFQGSLNHEKSLLSNPAFIAQLKEEALSQRAQAILLTIRNNDHEAIDSLRGHQFILIKEYSDGETLMGISLTKTLTKIPKLSMSNSNIIHSSTSSSSSSPPSASLKRTREESSTPTQKKEDDEEKKTSEKNSGAAYSEASIDKRFKQELSSSSLNNSFSSSSAQGGSSMFSAPINGYGNGNSVPSFSMGSTSSSSSFRSYSSSPTRQSLEELNRKPLGITLKPQYIEQIKKGLKTVEGRINSGMFSSIPEGRLLRFFADSHKTEVICKVIKINRYSSFREMLDKEGYKQCVNEAGSLDLAEMIYMRIPDYPEKARRSGVLAFQLQVISNSTENK